MTQGYSRTPIKWMSFNHAFAEDVAALLNSSLQGGSVGVSDVGGGGGAGGGRVSWAVCSRANALCLAIVKQYSYRGRGVVHSFFRKG